MSNKRTERRRGGKQLLNVFLSFDAFGEDIGFTDDQGKRHSPSVFTTLISLLVYALLLAYAT